MNVDDEIYQQMMFAKREREKRQKISYEEKSKEALRKNISKKITTTLIGSINLVEDYFGRIWGHKKGEELTDNERRWLEVWQECRTEILNKGNNQLRAAQNEINQYDIKWNKHEITMKPKT